MSAPTLASAPGPATTTIGAGAAPGAAAAAQNSEKKDAANEISIDTSALKQQQHHHQQQAASGGPWTSAWGGGGGGGGGGVVPPVAAAIFTTADLGFGQPLPIPLPVLGPQSRPPVGGGYDEKKALPSRGRRAAPEIGDAADDSAGSESGGSGSGSGSGSDGDESGPETEEQIRLREEQARMVAIQASELEEGLEQKFNVIDMLLHSKDIRDFDLDTLRTHLLGHKLSSREYREAIHSLLAVIELTIERLTRHAGAAAAKQAPPVPPVSTTASSHAPPASAANHPPAAAAHAHAQRSATQPLHARHR
jgi:hypothetical protein